ncbi:MAG: hypothetical protein CTY15_01320 [Methylocystis sp.]|nr:MAG: hypothetical protein CTY15_01320 [Methylocystis sp.]
MRLISHDAQVAYGNNASVDRFVSIDRLNRFLFTRPPRSASLDDAAIHECGHLVAFEAENLIAWSAKINGGSNGHEWCGLAQRARDFGSYVDAPHFLAEARATLAGPIAEELLSQSGSLASSIAELVGARICVERAAELLFVDPESLWIKTVREAAALVERYAKEIEALAELLEKRKKITASSPSVRKILKRVQGGVSASCTISPQAQHACDDIIRLVAEVSP